MIHLRFLLIVVWVCFVGLPCICRGVEPVLIDTGAVADGAKVSYLGEPSQNGLLRLTANNGFFDKGSFQAVGKRPAPSDAERGRIHFHYSHLIATESQSKGTAHWYLWIPQAGNMEVKVDLRAPANDAGLQWTVQLDDQSRQLVANSSNGPQNWDIAFSVTQPGLHRVSIRKVSPGPSSSEIHQIELKGPAIEKASLLRARWRPAAIHTQYLSSACPKTRMWIMETQNVSDHDSYSPITTPFGYFGGSLTADRRASGNLNFSMWAANRNAKTAPPLSETPHLLATGNPDAEFGGFGHEGSGVKIRNWEPLSHRPSSIVQALRMEVRDGQATYSGYFFDDRVSRWVLYAVGRRPLKNKKSDSLRISSFCEIPGPADRQRTGDRRRKIRRRGWVLDSRGNWHPIDQQTRGIKPTALPTNQSISVDQDGWFVMTTGGMEMLEPKTSIVKGGTQEKPRYMQPQVLKQLFQYPAEFAVTFATPKPNGTATIGVNVKSAGENAKATLYYGSQDCLSFVGRKDFHATESKGVIGKMFGADRVWESATPSQSLVSGLNEFQLSELKPNSTYFFRLMLTNDVGKIWSFEPGQFKTK